MGRREPAHSLQARGTLSGALAGTDPQDSMPSLRDKHKNASLRGLTAAVLATLALVAIAGSAMAGQDQLKGGSVVLQLQGSRALKLKPTTLNLAITGGAIDPIDGSGTVQVSGGFKAKRGKRKAKVTITSFTFGANGGPGNIAAKVGKRKVGSFGTLAGGTVTRDGWGARIENVSASLAGKGAKALNRAFSGRKHKGAKKSGGGKVKAGQPLGTHRLGDHRPAGGRGRAGYRDDDAQHQRHGSFRLQVARPLHRSASNRFAGGRLAGRAGHSEPPGNDVHLPG